MKIEYVNITDLVAAEYNPRKLSKKQHADIRASLEEFGFIDPVIVNKNESRRNVIIGGHQRVKVWGAMGNINVPVFYIDLSLEKEKELNIRLNKNTGEWDFDILFSEFDRVELAEWGFEDTDFPEAEVLPPDETIGDDDVGEPPEIPVTVLGDIYELGGHRLLCGDSTSIDAVEKLMNGVKADMVFTDPPYGVSFVGVKGSFYSGGMSSGEDSAKEIKNDDLRGEDLSRLFQDSMVCAVSISKEKASFYLFFAINRSSETLDGLSKCEIEIRNWLIWDKGNVGFHAMGAQYKPNYEAFLYCHKVGQSPEWIGDFNQQTIWRHAGEKLGLHPTMKPVALIEQAFGNHPGLNTLDLFGGSGSTLIACEKTGRKCYMMELDPKYCDVIVKRYVNFCKENGREYSVLLNGQPYNEESVT